MRRRRYRRDFYEERESRKIFYISISIVVLAIITFLITYAIYSNAMNKKIKAGELNKITELSALQNISTENDLNTEQTSISIGKSINETTEEQNKDNSTNNIENKEETNKMAINTSNIIRSEKEDNNIKEEKVEQKEIVQTSSTPTEAEKDPTFIKPIEGEIIREFAIESLVYSDTLKEWITHTGVDIKAEKKSIVKAAADGIVSAIKNDPRYGLTVIIKHANGFKTIYSNLLTAEFVKEGEEIKQGQTIGTIGSTASFEILDESHLHFEILKDNGYLNPIDYIK